MPKIFAYQVDDETAYLIEADIQALSQEVGQPLTSSQYHRLVINHRLQGQSGSPVQRGWREGFSQGYAKFNRAVQTMMRQKYVEMGLEEAPAEDDVNGSATL